MCQSAQLTRLYVSFQHLWALDAGLEKKLSGLEVPEMYAEKEEDEERKRAAAAKYLADKRAKEAAGQ